MRLPARHCSIRHRHAAPLSCADERPPPDVFVLAGDVASSLLYGAVESATDGWLVVAEGRDAATDPDVLPLPLLQAGELAVWWVLCGLLIGAYDPRKTRGDVVRALTAAAQTWVFSCALLPRIFAQRPRLWAGSHADRAGLFHGQLVRARRVAARRRAAAGAARVAEA